MFNFRRLVTIYVSFSLILGSFAAPIYASENNKEIRAIRKVLIVPKGQIEQGVEMSKQLGISEVAEGIPPCYQDKVTQDMLPYVYEEIIYKDETKPTDIPEQLQSAMEKLGADIAEYYPVFDKDIEPGDLVSILNKKDLILNVETRYLIEKSGQIYDPKLMGVISSESAMIIGKGNSAASEQILRPVALTGRAPVKVNLENGSIKIGDYLTSSNVPGIAMKAIGQGKVVGMALEPLDEIDSELGYTKIMMFINVGWYNSPSATSTDSLLVGGLFEGLKNIVSAVVDAITGIPKMIVNGILEVKNNVVAHGFFKGIFRVSKILVQGRTIIVDNAATAENSQLEIESEDEESFSFVTYSIVSPRKEIMVSGSGRLRLISTSTAEVEARIAFHPYFSAILSEEHPVRVIVTPTTYINGHLYVAEKSIYGFTVKEINSQDEGAEFDWIVTARLTDPERAQEVLETTKTIAVQEMPEVKPQACQNGKNRPCSSEIGACQVGVQICEQGVWGECIGAVFPADEICDEVDNDCDGEVDEDNVCSSMPINEAEPPPNQSLGGSTSTDSVSTSTEPIVEPEFQATSSEPIIDTSTSTDITASTNTATTTAQ